MKKTIITTIGILMAIPLIFAMYGGETETLRFGFETDNCTIVPNITEGVEFNFTSNNIIIKPSINFIGSFNVTCYDWLTKEEESQYSSGSSSAAPKDWSAKCGYNKECLYGKVNETSDIPDEVTEVGGTPDPITSEEGIDAGKIALTILITVLSLIFLTYFSWKIFKKKEESINDNTKMEEH